METIKKEFEIDEEIIVQKFDHEWEEYVDINSMTEVEDRSKLRVILKKKVLMKFIIFYKKIKALQNSVGKLYLVCPACGKIVCMIKIMFALDSVRTLPLVFQLLLLLQLSSVSIAFIL